MLEIICDMTIAELRELMLCIKTGAVGEAKKGGRRLVSISGDGQAATYDFGSVRPNAVYRAARRELVRRGCLEPKPPQVVCLDLNPCPPQPKCCDEKKVKPCPKDEH